MNGQIVPLAGGAVEAAVSRSLGQDRLAAIQAQNQAAVTTNAMGMLALVPGSIACTRSFIGLNNISVLKARTLSYAAYSQATYDVTDKFSITAGLRFTEEKKEINRITRLNDPRAIANRVAPEVFANPNGLITTQFQSTVRFSEFTPMVNLKYQFTDDINAYTTFARGFKSGGFNGRAGDANSFDPEILTSYETGLKSRFFDDRLQLNLATFTNVYKGIQLTVIGNDQNNNIIITVDNAGKAIIHGGEIESTLLVPGIDGLVLSGNLGITAARYKTFDRVGFKDVNLPNTPAYTGSATAAYTLGLGRFGDLSPRVTWAYTAQKTSDVSDPHYTRVPKHGVLSARISWAMPDGKTNLAIFGNNLLDREYFANAIDINALGTAFYYYAPPLTYGLELSRSF
jgi:iron complex outermembrane receptor protein